MWIVVKLPVETWDGISGQKTGMNIVRFKLQIIRFRSEYDLTYFGLGSKRRWSVEGISLSRTPTIVIEIVY